MAEQFETSPRVFRDPIHHYMSFSPLACRMINTKHMQRLRHIKQLGGSYFVWPGASHNRFEHSLGVGFVARRMADRLRLAQPELGITLAHVRCVELAGLCHDLGHGPFSHLWDGLYMPRAQRPAPGEKEWTHEEASELMFEHMLAMYGIDMEEWEREGVMALIAGDKERCELGRKMPFLFDIVSNKRNGIDVDKFDYIMRDSHAIDEPINLSLDRLVDSARVIGDQIAYDAADAWQLHEVCRRRFDQHRRMCNHETTRAVEYMIVDALLAAEPHMRLAERAANPEKYLYLTDDVLCQVEASESPELAPARDIIERIHTSDLYTSVIEHTFGWEMENQVIQAITPQNIYEVHKPQRNGRSITPEDIVVHVALLHCGMKERDPLELVKFYNTASSSTTNYLRPAAHAEVLLRVYARRTGVVNEIAAATAALIAEIENRHNAGLVSTSNNNDVYKAPNGLREAPTEVSVPLPPLTPPMEMDEELPMLAAGGHKMKRRSGRIRWSSIGIPDASGGITKLPGSGGGLS
ncbi:HD-domain PDEase-like protein [Coniophora puteana RWD-64-598 SS2]|uniref:HD-domain PDEase-like protein n=1 Tax=Coniophora puteana (strain RWD-64-598) TaxID=741705 RepID=A0A5M3MRT1_CONPW|nr:HD-domain PDEase-like protein [Coniophora puteana RWD-64-598 SS2]EIW81777.1 HD-domain PDEase-like protein [Coniophora puteana RWD-64-598 SS2]